MEGWNAETNGCEYNEATCDERAKRGVGGRSGNGGVGWKKQGGGGSPSATQLTVGELSLRPTATMAALTES